MAYADIGVHRTFNDILPLLDFLIQQHGEVEGCEMMADKRLTPLTIENAELGIGFVGELKAIKPGHTDLILTSIGAKKESSITLNYTVYGAALIEGLTMLLRFIDHGLSKNEVEKIEELNEKADRETAELLSHF